MNRGDPKQQPTPCCSLRGAVRHSVVALLSVLLALLRSSGLDCLQPSGCPGLVATSRTSRNHETKQAMFNKMSSTSYFLDQSSSHCCCVLHSGGKRSNGKHTSLEKKQNHVFVSLDYHERMPHCSFQGLRVRRRREKPRLTSLVPYSDSIVWYFPSVAISEKNLFNLAHEHHVQNERHEKALNQTRQYLGSARKRGNRDPELCI